MNTAKDEEIIASDMSAKEYYEGYFNLDFLSEEERDTIYRATELYAKGKVRVALAAQPKQEAIPEEDKPFLEAFKKAIEPDKCNHKWITVCSKCGKDKPMNF